MAKKLAPAPAPAAALVAPMSVSLLVDTFSDALGIVTRSVPAKTTLPILSNVLLTAAAGTLTLTATDLNVAVVHTADAVVTVDGAITLPARLLADWVAQLEKGTDVSLVLNPATLVVHLTCGRFECDIPGLAAEDFPPVAGVAADAGLSLGTAELKVALGQVIFAAAPDDSRPVLAGVLVRVVDSVLTLAAADGFRLSARSITLPDGGAAMSIIVPAKAFAEVARLLPDDDETAAVLIRSSETHAHFGFGATSLTTRLIDGAYPDFERIIPAADAIVATVKLSLGDLLRATRAAAVFARDNSNIVRLAWDASDAGVGVVTVTSTSATEGKSASTLDAAVKGTGMHTAYNGRYMRDALGAIEAEEVVLQLAGPMAPGLLRAVDGSGALHVLMPMQTSNGG